MNTRSPSWVSDELILALDVYFLLNHKDITASNTLVIELSDFLRSLPIHTYRPDKEKFRNSNGVAMEIRTFLKYDSTYEGIGLTRGNKLQYKIWTNYENDRGYLHKVASAIRRCLPLPFPYCSVADLDQMDFIEGTILYQYHRFVECDIKRVERLRDRAQSRGIRGCNICGFDYYQTYGEVGSGLMECHHTLDITEYSNDMVAGDNDFILVCSNCHRMLHRMKRPVDKYDLKQLLKH